MRYNNQNQEPDKLGRKKLRITLKNTDESHEED